MTDSAALLKEIKKVLADELPGTKQLVRHRIAAGIHGKLKSQLEAKDLREKHLTNQVAALGRQFEMQQKRTRERARNAARLAIDTMEKIYGEET